MIVQSGYMFYSRYNNTCNACTILCGVSLLSQLRMLPGVLLILMLPLKPWNCLKEKSYLKTDRCTAWRIDSRPTRHPCLIVYGYRQQPSVCYSGRSHLHELAHCFPVCRVCPSLASAAEPPVTGCHATHKTLQRWNDIQTQSMINILLRRMQGPSACL